MTNVTTKSDSFEPATDTAAHLFDNWFDPIESGVRERVREFIETLICEELDAALARPRYGRAKNGDACSAGIVGHRHGCLLYTSDAADERSSVDLGGRRIIK